MTLRKWGGVLGVSILLLILSPLLKYVDAFSGETIYFSEQDHFYDHALEIELKSQFGSTLYYTLDGETPSPDATLYTEPIKLPLPETGISVTTIRAIAYTSDGSISNERVHTYFIGKEVFERYQSLITVVTADPYDLYDYDHGIFVPGRLRDEWISENPDRTLKPSRPANYNIRGREAERPAYLEVFTSDGTCILSQSVGIRVNGGYSRADDRKSIKIYAREEYGANKLHYEFFPNASTYTTNQPITEYKRLILRNNITTENASMLELIDDVELLDVQACQPCVGYLNGAYYQAGWMLEAYDNAYFHNNYGTNENSGSWQIVADYNEANIEGTPVDTIFETLHEGQAALDKAYYDAFANKSFLDDDIFEAFCEIVDLENMLWYFAVEIYTGNTDWPYNNIKMYRWYSNTGEYTPGTHMDGKWRYLVYDLDGGFSCGVTMNLLSHVLEPENSQGRFHPIFYNLMQREDIRQRFIEIVTELTETVFEPDYTSQILNSRFSFSETELLTALEQEPRANQEFLSERLETVRRHHARMLEFAYARPAEIMKQIEEWVDTNF